MDLLCLVSRSQPALVVHVEAPWQSFEEFVAGVRQKPAYYVIANSGTGSIWHVNSLLLERGTGLQFIHCPFGGSSGALTALLGQHVDAAVAGVGEMAPHVEAGRMRALAVFGKQRSSLYPDVPATGELGYDFGANAWSGFYAPQGLPPDRTEKLVASIKEAAATEAFARLCAERGMEPVFLGPQEFREFADEQATFFAKAIPDLLGGAR
jgi:putative tricarboxylic transport membrane protein